MTMLPYGHVHKFFLTTSSNNTVISYPDLLHRHNSVPQQPHNFDPSVPLPYNTPSLSAPTTAPIVDEYTLSTAPPLQLLAQLPCIHNPRFRSNSGSQSPITTPPSRSPQRCKYFRLCSAPTNTTDFFDTHQIRDSINSRRSRISHDAEAHVSNNHVSMSSVLSDQHHNLQL
ncbi:unnamed protein product [Vicia faba]|uniref:Uncharacterized protein n=1 Tax=Vicia faba TaxID=3906 RepID=A0AAV0Z4K9_VICFA|nr:unnamed protein product [Vicia faba]